MYHCIYVHLVCGHRLEFQASKYQASNARFGRCKFLNFLLKTLRKIFFLEFDGNFSLFLINQFIFTLFKFQIKWSSFESKLRHIEKELNQHHAVVGEIKSAVDQMVVQSEFQQKQPKRPLEEHHEQEREKEPKIREFKAVGDEPPRMHTKFNASICPILTQSVPKTDVQVIFTLMFKIKII